MKVRPFTSEAVLDAIRSHLARRRVCVLATSVNDVPWAAASFYVARDLDMFVCQGRRARTLANMRINPRTAFAVDDRKAEAWLQGTGRVEFVTGQDEVWARESLRAAAPEFTHHFTNPEQPVLIIRPQELTFADRENGIYPRQHLVMREGVWVFGDDA